MTSRIPTPAEARVIAELERQIARDIAEGGPAKREAERQAARDAENRQRREADARRLTDAAYDLESRIVQFERRIGAPANRDDDHLAVEARKIHRLFLDTAAEQRRACPRDLVADAHYDLCRSRFAQITREMRDELSAIDYVFAAYK